MQRYCAVCKKPIPLGYARENLAREIAFDLKDLKNIYGNGNAQLMVRRTGENVGYPVPLTIDGDYAIWKVTEADSAIPGYDGSCELSYSTEDGVFAKSETWSTYVLASMTCDICDPPTVAENWMNELRKSAAETQINANSAAASAATAEEWAKKAEEFANSSGTGGGTGESGKDGEDGVGIKSIERTSGDGSPGTTDTYTITLTDGTSYTFTVYNGADGKDGADGVGGGTGGANGKDGITPHIGSNGNWFLGDTDTGVKAKGEDGTDGKDGQDGYTPVKGVDYFDGADGADGTDGITPHIGENKNWWIGETDTGVKAEGKDGKDGSGGSSGSSDVYSTEEIVVGTWIDGKPIYRLPIQSITGSKVATDNLIYSATHLNLDFLLSVHGCVFLSSGSKIPVNTTQPGNLSCGCLYSEPLGGFAESHSVSAMSGCPLSIVIEYTKTTDTATIDIPSAMALRNAYDEGVNEA